MLVGLQPFKQWTQLAHTCQYAATVALVYTWAYLVVDEVSSSANQTIQCVNVLEQHFAQRPLGHIQRGADFLFCAYCLHDSPIQDTTLYLHPAICCWPEMSLASVQRSNCWTAEHALVERQ